jgi:hypothetical protein
MMLIAVTGDLMPVTLMAVMLIAVTVIDAVSMVVVTGE